MRRIASTAVALAFSAALAGPAEAGVVITMPRAPVPSGLGSGYSATDEIDLGEVALYRYSQMRHRPRGGGAAQWSRRGWGGRYAGGRFGGGWPGYGPCLGGGYRISLSPFQVFAIRGWHGGYIWPSWGW